MDPEAGGRGDRPEPVNEPVDCSCGGAVSDLNRTFGDIWSDPEINHDAAIARLPFPGKASLVLSHKVAMT